MRCSRSFSGPARRRWMRRGRRVSSDDRVPHVITSPLRGLRVVECAGSLATSFAGKLLNDMGASLAWCSIRNSDGTGSLDREVADPRETGYEAYVNGGKVTMSGES